MGHAVAVQEGLYRSCGFADRDTDQVNKYAKSMGLAVCNTLFQKRSILLITESSGVDYILTRTNQMNLVNEVNVFPAEECVTEHNFLRCVANN